jgi:hypothetical protein
MGNSKSAYADIYDTFLGLTWKQSDVGVVYVSLHVGYAAKQNPYSDLLPDLNKGSLQIVDGNRVVRYTSDRIVGPMALTDFISKALPKDLLRSHRVDGHVFVEPGMELRLCSHKSRWEFTLSDTNGGFLRDVRAPKYVGPLTDLLCLLSHGAYRESERLHVSLDIQGRKSVLSYEERITIRELARNSPVQHLRLGVLSCSLSAEDIDFVAVAFMSMPDLRTLAVEVGDSGNAWRESVLSASERKGSPHLLNVWISGRDTMEEVVDLKYDRRMQLQLTSDARRPFDDSLWRSWMKESMPVPVPYQFSYDDDDQQRHPRHAGTGVLDFRHDDLDALLLAISTSAGPGAGCTLNIQYDTMLEYSGMTFTDKRGAPLHDVLVRICNAIAPWEEAAAGRVYASVHIESGGRVADLNHASVPQLAKKLDDLGVHPLVQKMWTSGRLRVTHPIHAYGMLPKGK